MSDSVLRRLPPVSEVLERDDIRLLREEHGHEPVVRAIRQELQILRDQLVAGVPDPAETSLKDLTNRVTIRVKNETAARLRVVINATGIVLHTNLGRSPLAEEAARAAYAAARGYLNLELDLRTGKRSSRQDPIRDVLCPLLGCESATVVNNCAAATVLVLRALAAGREVVVSRGQLVEIGGSFRIPDIMAVSGATLREVGTTNITRIEDYERAIQPQTALLMRIHHSNFRIRGFTLQPSLAELIMLGRERQIPVIDDVGSGAMFDFATLGLPGDPVVRESLEQGADLVLFSGDKLLGGPQAGVIAGRKELVARIEKDPLMRAFRLDKMTLAALEATLHLYRRPGHLLQSIPILRMLSVTPEELRTRAEQIASGLSGDPGLERIEVRLDQAFVGGGSLPDQPLDTVVVALRPATQSDEVLASRLRTGTPAVLARIQDGEILLDPRTVLPDQQDALVAAVRAALVA